MAKRGGARPGAGRKSKAEEMGLAALLDECWTLEDRKACVRSLAVKAKAGDEHAINTLFAYTWGRPKEKVEQSGKVSIEVIYVDPPPTP